MKKPQIWFLSFVVACLLHILVFFIPCQSFLLPFGVAAVSCAILFHVVPDHELQMSIRACALGSVFGLGGLITWRFPWIWMVGIYVMFITNFHMTEYLFISIYFPHALSQDSFLLNHGSAYFIAIFAPLIGFSAEYYFYPEMKGCNSLILFGITLCLSEEIIRKLAIATAGDSFSHLVEQNKKTHHKLVTHGIFSLCRYPSYLGWFLFAVGTQFILLNPVCALAYALVSWTKFRQRIPHEEIYLLDVFGEDYAEYQKRVPTGLPLISGYSDET